MRFPSREWLEALFQALNRQPDLGRALAGLGPDAAAVVEADPPALAQDLAVWGRHAGGRIAEWRLLDDADELLELEPAYLVRAPYRVWVGLLSGDDPLQAALSGRVKVRGDLESLVRRASFRYVAEAALAEVPTELLEGEAR